MSTANVWRMIFVVTLCEMSMTDSAGRFGAVKYSVGFLWTTGSVEGFLLACASSPFWGANYLHSSIGGTDTGPTEDRFAAMRFSVRSTGLAFSREPSRRRPAGRVEPDRHSSQQQLYDRTFRTVRGDGPCVVLRWSILGRGRQTGHSRPTQGADATATGVKKRHRRESLCLFVF